jgi:hypothetical protein
MTDPTNASFADKSRGGHLYLVQTWRPKAAVGEGDRALVEKAFEFE